MSMIDVISDYSNKNLDLVPNKVLEMFNLKMLYLEGNMLQELPEDFFKKLSRLTWLDLRKNHLRSIPAGIADHLCLETLLLQDNEIEELPNELGLVPNLKVLQLNGNPLKYPYPEIIQEGIQLICNFLKQEYYKSNEVQISEDDEEKEISIIEPKSVSQLSKNDEKLTVRDILRRSGKKSHLFSVMPVIDVKSLNKEPPKEANVKIRHPNYYALRPSSVKKTHKITKSCSKISLQSHAKLNSKKINGEDKAQEGELKDLWMKRLKELLADQEKILQQEKNLSTLNNWRLKKKSELPRTSLEDVSEAPYDTDPDLRMLSRKDLTAQIDQMLKNSKKPYKREQSAKKVDIQNLINQVVEQMKSMETKLGSKSPRSPRIEKDVATRQIQNIVELHKKIMKLQVKNDTTLTG